MINILNISTNDFGGAGSAALRVHRAFLSENFNSLLLVKHSKSNERGVISVRKSTCLSIFFRIYDVIKCAFFFKNRYLMYGTHKAFFRNINRIMIRYNYIPDIIVIHWISGFINLNEILELQKKYCSKIIVYFMDMANFTGGCHFSNGCNGFQSSCQNCPADRVNITNGLPYRILKEKARLYSKMLVMPVAPNHFVSTQVKSSSVFNNKAPVVAYIPILPSIFIPKHSGFCCAGIINVLFGSADLFSVSRKGGDLFAVMLEHFSRLALTNSPPRTVNVFIPGLQKKHEKYTRYYSIKSLDYAYDEISLARLYQLNDFFVCCSREDSGPMMISEALMSGTPVLSFNVGSASELISNGINGYVVKAQDVKEMACRLFDICHLSENQMKELRAGARRIALKKLSPGAFIDSLALELL